MSTSRLLHTHSSRAKAKEIESDGPVVRRQAPYLFRKSSGQATVETALMVSAAALILVVAVECAILLKKAYAVNQLAYQGARYAAINPGYNPSTIVAYMLQAASPDLTQNNDAQLAITISPNTVPRAAGTAVTVNVTYTFPDPIKLGVPLVGLDFPSSVAGTDTTMTE